MISIVTPSYNQGEFIEETILSVKNQNYNDFEHIVMDGGSGDNTLDILNKYENEYNLDWISEDDNGQSNAINKGVKKTSGDIIGWLNSDDVYIYKDTFQIVSDFFKDNPDVDILFGDLALLNKKGKILRTYVYQDFDQDKLLEKRYNIGQPATFFKADVLKDNLIDESLDYVMDYELWIRLAKKGYKFKHIPKVLAGFRVYEEAKSTKESMGKLKKEMDKVLFDYGGGRNDNFLIKVKDKILRGGWARISGLFRLMKNKYLNLRKIDDSNRYFKFPLDIIKQCIGKGILK